MRYSLMKASNIREDKHNSFYPDILTMNLDNIFIEDSAQIELNATQIDRLDLLVFNFYGRMDYMDLVLELNNVEHRSRLSTGDILKLPPKNLLDRIIMERKKS